MDPITILVVDDEPEHRHYIRSLLEVMVSYSFIIDEAHDVDSALTAYDRKWATGTPYDVIFVDLVQLPPENLGGKAVVMHVYTSEKKQPSTKLILMSSHDPKYEHSLGLVSFGVTDFLRKPISRDEFQFRVSRVLEEILLRRRVLDLQQQIELGKEDTNSRHQLIGCLRSGKFYNDLGRIAESGLTVLILGETGTGKEVIASEIRRLSSKPEQPFISINCAKFRNMDSSILIGEMFGYEKGSHHGATRRKKGFVELAAGGTLFIDEIGASSDDFQAMLLRFLEEGTYETLAGETKTAKVRILAATNENLEEAIAKGTFREDLFARLEEFSVKLPPLRERRADIRPIAEHFLNRFRQGIANCRVERISGPAMKQLENHDWPLNVRELRNVIRRICFLSQNMEVLPEDVAEQMSNYHSQIVPISSGWKFTGEAIRRTVSVKREVARLELSYLKYFQDNGWSTSTIGQALGSVNPNLSQYVSNRETYLNQLSDEAPQLVAYFKQKYPKSLGSTPELGGKTND